MDIDCRPILLPSKSRVAGSRFIGEFKFENGGKVPVYDVFSTSALNQLIGHAKFKNATYGNVYYRGVNGLFNNVMPSIMRKRKYGDAHDLNQIINRICDDDYFKESLKLKGFIYSKKVEDIKRNKGIKKYNRYRVEALLQHYAGKTRFIDVVDNHWVAMWMGLQTFHAHGKGNQFCDCRKRELNIIEIYDLLKSCDSLSSLPDSKNDFYEYIILIAMPYSSNDIVDGVMESSEFVEVDLRKALPSIYLRPHAQHALVVRRRDNNNTENTASYYDMASQVIGILRISIDRASIWLGDGALLTSDNLFPSPSVDQGYNNLLMHDELFTHPFEIVRYY